jgi:GMP synthase (glutamine-hydrolysing)
MDGFEIGYNEISRLREDPLFDGLGDSFTAFTTHGDAVVELPPSATLLAENEHGVHAFRDGHCWGVQFHPEYDIETARDVTDGKRDQIGDARVDTVLESITPAAYDAACEAKALFENFTAYAERLAADGTEPAAADD